MPTRPGFSFGPVEYYDADGNPIRIPAGYEDAGQAPMRFQFGEGFGPSTWNETTKRMELPVSAVPGPQGPAGADGAEMWPVVATGTATTVDPTPVLLATYTLDVTGYSYTLLAEVQVRDGTGRVSDCESRATFLADAEADFMGSTTNVARATGHIAVTIQWGDDGMGGADALLYVVGLEVVEMSWEGSIRLKRKRAL